MIAREEEGLGGGVYTFPSKTVRITMFAVPALLELY